jgi:hypothetical protein
MQIASVVPLRATTSRLLEVATLQPGEYFGELGLIGYAVDHAEADAARYVIPAPAGGVMDLDAADVAALSVRNGAPSSNRLPRPPTLGVQTARGAPTVSARPNGSAGTARPTSSPLPPIGRGGALAASRIAPAARGGVSASPRTTSRGHVAVPVSGRRAELDLSGVTALKPTSKEPNAQFASVDVRALRAMVAAPLDVSGDPAHRMRYDHVLRNERRHRERAEVARLARDRGLSLEAARRELFRQGGVLNVHLGVAGMSTDADYDVEEELRSGVRLDGRRAGTGSGDDDSEADDDELSALDDDDADIAYFAELDTAEAAARRARRRERRLAGFRRQATILAQVASELLVLPRAAFLAHFDRSALPPAGHAAGISLLRMREYATGYPTAAAIRQHHEHRRRWSEFRRDVVQRNGNVTWLPL